MHEDEVPVDDATVRSLLVEQFPAWADQPLRRIADSGTDNAIYRLGETMGLRLPRIAWAKEQIDKEGRWLPTLAGGLPVPVPVPIATGRPGRGYPFPWLVYRWLDGVSLDGVAPRSWNGLARDIAEFLRALQQLPAAGGPAPRRRGTPMAQYDSVVRQGLERVRGLIDVDQARAIWQRALNAGDWTGESVWVHGDLLPGNLLVRDDRLCGVIDWSGAGLGDPSCDAMVAWSLPPEGRRIFRQAVAFDDATWARARGWVVEQTVLYIPYYERTLPFAVEQAKQRLRAVLHDGE